MHSQIGSVTDGIGRLGGGTGYGDGAVDYIIKEHGYVTASPCAIEYAHVLAAYSALRLAHARAQADTERV